MLRNVENQVQGFRTKDGAGVSLVRILGFETADVYDPFLMENGTFIKQAAKYENRPLPIQGAAV